MTGCITKLGRLGRDNAGNTLAIAAASLIPLMALIGGGVDISRAYMAKTELQSACDAGVLAGRKAMSKSGSYGTSEKAKATSMFNFNFSGDKLNVEDLSYTTDDNEDGQVLGTATATLPTLVMKIFDRDEVELSVDCMAELQIGNADIMFVLDTTGSMGQSITSGEPSKIAGLRDAVKDFHKTINQAVTDNRTRIRYGFVPYSMTVNVGGLVTDGSLSTAYLADTLSLNHTRRAYFNTPVYVADPTVTTNDIEWYVDGNGNKIKISSSNCTNYGKNDYPTDKPNPVTTGSAPNDVVKITYTYGGRGTESTTNKSCYRKRKIETTTYDVEYKFTSWDYSEDSVNTSSFKTKSTVSYADWTQINTSSSARVQNRGYYDMEFLKSAQGVANIPTTTAAWNGCIEERDTVDESDFDPIPEGALDLDLDLVPDDERSTQWRPMWPALKYSYQYDYGDRRWEWQPASSACPAPMMLFRTVELSDNADDVPTWLNTYVTNLNPEGNTYHDIGMIWGGRLTSPTGLFAENVTLDADKINVSKHIIFMTDGIMEPTASGYSAYGVETDDTLIAPSGTDSEGLKPYHNERFKAMCNAIKAQGTTIWVVAFGTSMTSSLQGCASDGRAYYSSNTTALRNTFKYIAAQVADLRLGA
jgi:Flp pilus assembly protein TadG